MKSDQTGYGAVAIAIHWASAFLILVLIASGFASGFAQDAATKVAALRIHLPAALLVLAITVVRLAWWWRLDRKPPPIGGLPAWQETAARWTHRTLYVAIVALLVSGIAMAALSGLPVAVFGAAPLPDLAALPPRAGHGLAARLILAAITLHVAAALYHHWVLRDATLRRIWRRPAA
ncbi:cytochrome b [Salinarimonas chemoclinalis]|uniref:cytochrome b n=1 Tax=Salinarimonas chemoclinalis TaxID=3241599 RepID=UPI003558E3B1